MINYNLYIIFLLIILISLLSYKLMVITRELTNTKQRLRYVVRRAEDVVMRCSGSEFKQAQDTALFIIAYDSIDPVIGQCVTSDHNGSSYQFRDTLKRKLNKEIEQLRKEREWISFDGDLPKYNEPVILCINGVVQHVTFMLDSSDDSCDWFEPYHYEDTDSAVFIDGKCKVEWMALPAPPNNTSNQPELPEGSYAHLAANGSGVSNE